MCPGRVATGHAHHDAGKSIELQQLNVDGLNLIIHF